MINDNVLQTAVQDELRWEPSVIAAHIGVTAKAGVVTLSGHVGDFASKYAAEKAARRVKGVMAVAEEIEVHLPSDAKRSDDEIAAAAVERLAWNVSIPRDAVKVKVEKGLITLTGTVHSFYQKQAALQDVRRLFGVVGVSNQIAIKAQPDALAVSDGIAQALHRSLFDPKMIKVTAQNGNIRLTGSVHSLYERRLAANTAWAAPGAMSVENEISIH
ncbi:MAG: BON domain-containing protein [Caulobacteraceae bacterium]|jgi:osmotically-inducible protein OsmY